MIQMEIDFNENTTKNRTEKDLSKKYTMDVNRQLDSEIILRVDSSQPSKSDSNLPIHPNQTFTNPLQSETSLNQIQLVKENETPRPTQAKVNTGCQTLPLHLMETALNEELDLETSLKRKEVFLFLFNCFCILNVSCLNIMFFFTGDSPAKFDFIFINIGIICAFFLFHSIYTAHNVKQYFCLLFLIDNILLTQVVASMGFVGMMMVTFVGEYKQYLGVFLVPFMNVLMSLNFKLSLLNYKWNRAKTVGLKMVLLCGAVVCFGIGTYVMFINFKLTGGYAPKIDANFKDFTLLYTFGNFAFYNELYNKVGEFDRTGELEYDYQLVLEEDESQQKIDRKSQKIDKKSQKVEKFEGMQFHEIILSKQKLNESSGAEQGSQNKLYFI